jgi:hypothetical protein
MRGRNSAQQQVQRGQPQVILEQRNAADAAPV